MIVETTRYPKNEDGSPVIDETTQKPKEVKYSVDYDFGENLIGLLRVCGAGEVLDSLNPSVLEGLEALAATPAGMKVYYNARARIIVALQGVIRNWMDEDLSDGEIDSKVAAWDIPEGAPRTKDPVEKAEAMINNLSDAQLEELLKRRGLAD